MKNMHLFIILGIVVISTVSYLIYQNKNMAPLANRSAEFQVSPTTIPTGITEDSLRQGGSSFTDSQNIYSFLYPNDYVIDTQNNGQYARIFKRAEAERSQSEISNGVLMVFEGVNLNGQSLEPFVDDHIKQSTQDGNTKIIQQKTSTKFGEYPGFTYATKGFGEAEVKIFQKDSKSQFALVVTISVNDPQKKGYQQAVDAIMKTIQILK